MSFGRVFETISGEPHETDVLELLCTGAEVARNNARKHGLTAALAPKSVLEWYRIILNDPNAELSVMDALSDEQRLAVNLAQAEVRLRSVLHAIDEFEQERDPLFEELANQEHDYQLYLRFARNRDLDKWTRDASKILLQIIKKDIRKSQRQIENRTRLLQRYKREALSKQRKAQKAWSDQFKRN
ncbi:hypothetical protein UM181_00970 [Alphaproteobacteria bacterium US3C007]|nr:hypothetical protein UM181_00970 [Alphaproteobacteria bacterium US3C007]